MYLVLATALTLFLLSYYISTVILLLGLVILCFYLGCPRDAFSLHSIVNFPKNVFQAAKMRLQRSNATAQSESSSDLNQHRYKNHIENGYINSGGASSPSLLRNHSPLRVRSNSTLFRNSNTATPKSPTFHVSSQHVNQENLPLSSSRRKNINKPLQNSEILFQSKYSTPGHLPTVRLRKTLSSYYEPAPNKGPVTVKIAAVSSGLSTIQKLTSSFGANSQLHDQRSNLINALRNNRKRDKPESSEENAEHATNNLKRQRQEPVVSTSEAVSIPSSAKNNNKRAASIETSPGVLNDVKKAKNNSVISSCSSSRYKSERQDLNSNSQYRKRKQMADDKQLSPRQDARKLMKPNELSSPAETSIQKSQELETSPSSQPSSRSSTPSLSFESKLKRRNRMLSNAPEEKMSTLMYSPTLEDQKKDEEKAALRLNRILSQFKSANTSAETVDSQDKKVDPPLLVTSSANTVSGTSSTALTSSSFVKDPSSVSASSTSNTLSISSSTVPSKTTTSFSNSSVPISIPPSSTSVFSLLTKTEPSKSTTASSGSPSDATPSISASFKSSSGTEETQKKSDESAPTSANSSTPSSSTSTSLPIFSGLSSAAPKAGLGSSKASDMAGILLGVKPISSDGKPQLTSPFSSSGINKSITSPPAATQFASPVPSAVISPFKVSSTVTTNADSTSYKPPQVSIVSPGNQLASSTPKPAFQLESGSSTGIQAKSVSGFQFSATSVPEISSKPFQPASVSSSTNNPSISTSSLQFGGTIPAGVSQPPAKFGFGSLASTTAAPTTNVPQFGSPVSKTNPVSAGGFQFGSVANASVSNSVANPAPSSTTGALHFGSSATTTASSTPIVSSGFQFSSSKPAPAVAGFQFGSTAPSSSMGTNQTASTTSSFQFAAPAPNTPAPKPAFQFGSSVPPATTSNTFQFGSNTATTSAPASFQFGAPASGNASAFGTGSVSTTKTSSFGSDFSFGAAPKATASGPAPSSAFQFGSPAASSSFTASTGPKGGFKFESTAPNAGNAFQFGSPANTKANESATKSSSFQFGSANNNSFTANSTFTAANKLNGESAAAGSLFKFGAPAANQQSSGNSGTFEFGMSNQTPTPANTNGAFQFGSTSSTSAPPNPFQGGNAPAAGGVFQFGNSDAKLGTAQNNFQFGQQSPFQMGGAAQPVNGAAMFMPSPSTATPRRTISARRRRQ